jgi:hypothetical protein
VIYEYALYGIFQACGKAIYVCAWTCDFEKGLINAIRGQFGMRRDGITPSATIGCNFHWKQCLRRQVIQSAHIHNLSLTYIHLFCFQLIALDIDVAIVSELMGPDGLINLLPMVPIAEMRKAIAYIRFHFEELEEDKVKFDKFWRYFFKTWLRDYDPTLWNISAMTASGKVVPFELINRTNNALERYNRYVYTCVCFCKTCLC